MGENVELVVRYAPVLFDVVIRSVLIFLSSLGVVYILGRMLGILKTYRTKNVVALMAMAGFSYWSIRVYDVSVVGNLSEMYWKMAMYVSVSALFYVLVGFDLYDRFNGWSDKKFGSSRKERGQKK